MVRLRMKGISCFQDKYGIEISMDEINVGFTAADSDKDGFINFQSENFYLVALKYCGSFEYFLNVFIEFSEFNDKNCKSKPIAVFEPALV